MVILDRNGLCVEHGQGSAAHKPDSDADGSTEAAVQERTVLDRVVEFALGMLLGADRQR